MIDAAMPVKESRQKFPSDEHPKVLVRMPARLKEALQEAAVRNHRTLTGEILHRLEGSFDREALDGEVTLVDERSLAEGRYIDFGSMTIRDDAEVPGRVRNLLMSIAAIFCGSRSLQQQGGIRGLVEDIDFDEIERNVMESEHPDHERSAPRGR